MTIEIVKTREQAILGGVVTRPERPKQIRKRMVVDGFVKVTGISIHQEGPTALRNGRRLGPALALQLGRGHVIGVGAPGRRRSGVVIGEPGGLGLNLGGGEGAAPGNIGRVVGEVEAGVATAEAEEGGVEGTGRLLGGVVGAEPDALAAVGEADFGDPLSPLALPDSFVLGVASLRWTPNRVLHHKSEGGWVSE